VNCLSVRLRKRATGNMRRLGIGVPKWL